ncbi:MAG: hypothetical protein AAF703_00055 [Cyanobacteria bacterium P01_D01_bin.105]
MRTKTKEHNLALQGLAVGLLAGILLTGTAAIAKARDRADVRSSASWQTSGQFNRQTVPDSPQSFRQYDRIYLSTNGEFLGAHTIFGGTILFIDRTGDIELIARDYTAELDYDYAGRLHRIGAATIAYDYRGRVEQIGNRVIDYDFRSRLGQIGVDEIAYTPRGKVSQVGSVTIQYDRGYIDTISANYTSTGARIVIVGAD